MASQHQNPAPVNAPSPVVTPSPAIPAASGAAYASGSLYVGDLMPDVTEALLFEIFNPVGPVSSIRVCRDASTRRSLGYAYVNFHSAVDAERALDTLNFTPIKNKQCRIMWSQRNPAGRKSNSSNVFVKHLDKSFDNKALYDMFSAYGSILSCKIAVDDTNQSRGYGFVHYETDDGARQAIEKVNGMLMMDKNIVVTPFRNRSERDSAAKTFTNVYVKNIPTDWDQEKFQTTFEQFGNITSILLKVKDGSNQGFGFVNYENHDQAVQAVSEGSKIAVDGEKTLFVDRFQSRQERRSYLAKQFETKRRERSEKFKNLNLYVKNFDDNVDEETLKEWFSPYGTLGSVCVMRDDKKLSRGFGFVCFTTVEAANKALELNGKMFGTKPLYVNRAQRKEERKMLLETQFHPTPTAQRMAMGPLYYPPNMGMPQTGMFIQPAAMMRGRFPGAQPQMRANYPMYPTQVKGGRGRGTGGRGMGRGHKRFPANNMRGQQQQQQQQQQQIAPSVQVPPVPNPVVPQAQMQNPELTTRMLADMPPETQKQYLGERLFPMVQTEQPSLAGKITGMLLEMEVSEVLGVVESPTELRAKIQEALEVLQSHGGSQEPSH